jgi:Ca2+-binding RTX toxin-like protein
MSNTTRSPRRSSAEALESRRLLAATITGGVLVATGTDGADEISVRRVLIDDVVVTINGVAKTFDMDDFTGVRLEGLGGSDTFRLVDPLVSPVVRNTTVVGGDGNDRLVYSTRTAPLNFLIDPIAPTSTVTSGAQVDHFIGVETLVGGSGDDSFRLAQEDRTDDPAVSFRLEGRDGNDLFVDGIYPSSNAYGFVTMLGGAGDDRFSDESDQCFTREVFFGEAGNDTVGKYRSAGTFDGGSGIDTLNFRSGGGNLGNFPGFENATATWGGDSDAPVSLTGTDGPNHLSIDGSGTINALGGNDTIVGSDEADTLNGGGGDDLILGASGDDELDGGPSFDTLDGGVGNDTLVNGEVIPGVGRIRISNRVLTAEGTMC